MKIVERVKFWFRAYIREHHIVNLVWLNCHRVDERLLRSAQPTPGQLERIIRKHGIKTVINLRGRSNRAVYKLERSVCRSMGVRMVALKLSSRSPVQAENLENLKKAFENAEYPVLIHCKAGADRSSLASVLYRYWIRKEPLRAAIGKEMKFFPYGYIESSAAGILKYYFERFERDRREHGDIDLIEWTRKMDKEELKREFDEKKKIKAIDWVSEKLLKRE